MQREKQQWIMVMHKLRGKDNEYGMEIAYSITQLGAEEALRRAQNTLEHKAAMFRNLQYKLQGGEW